MRKKCAKEALKKKKKEGAKAHFPKENDYIENILTMFLMDFAHS